MAHTALTPTDQSNLYALGNRIYAVRTQQGLTQEQLAARVGCNPKTISAAENATQALSIVLVLRISDVLQVPVNDLVPDAYCRSRNKIAMSALAHKIALLPLHTQQPAYDSLCHLLDMMQQIAR